MSESILNATEEQLKNAQAKITYLGEQSKPIPTVVFFTEEHDFSMNRFTQLHRTHKEYDNDSLPYTMQFTVKPVEFKRLLHALKPLLSKEDIAKGEEFLSFCVVYKTDLGQEGYEFLINASSARSFYEILIDALEPDNEVGRKALTKQFKTVLG